MKKIFAVVLALSMLCAMTGCDKNEGSASTQESSTSTESTTGSVEESSSSPSAPDSSSEESTSSTSEPTAGQAEFDFDEAVKNITLFGNKISLPCTIADFGEDFSLDEDGYVPVFDDTKRMVCGLLYHNQEIGTVVLADCLEGDSFGDKEIVNLNLGFVWRGTYPYSEADILSLERMNCYTGKIEHDFAGLSYDSTEKDIKSVLGEPDTVDNYDDNYQMLWDFKYGNIRIVFNGNNHKIEQFQVSIKEV